MELLASCSLEKSKTFNGKLSIPNEDAKSPDKVSLNVVVTNEDDPTTVFEGLSGNEKCITFKDIPVPFCPDSWKGNVFHEISNIEGINAGILNMEGVIDLVQLPEGYSDMRTIKDYCEKYPSVRFIGGNLLQIDGVRIGRYDKGKEKMSFVLKDVYDTFVEVDLNDLSGLQEKVKKTRAKAESSTSVKKEKGEKKPREPKEKKEKTVSKRVMSFNNLFGGGSTEF